MTKMKCAPHMCVEHVMLLVHGQNMMTMMANDGDDDNDDDDDGDDDKRTSNRGRRIWRGALVFGIPVDGVGAGRKGTRHLEISG